MKNGFKTVICSVDSSGLLDCVRKCHEELTLDNMGDHQGSTAVITGQTSTGQVLFYLEGKQVPG